MRNNNLICADLSLLPVVFDDVFQRFVEGIRTEQPAKFMATLGLDAVQNRRDNQADAFFLQDPAKRADRLRQRKFSGLLFAVNRL